MYPVPTRFWFALPSLLCLAVSGWPSAAKGQNETSELPLAAVATGSGPLETAIVVERFIAGAPEGALPGARFVPARKVAAGEEVHYTIRVRNPGEAPVRDAVLTKRLPFGVDYIPGSAVGPACTIEVSIDGGRTFAGPARADDDLTHVRWILRRPLAPGATALLRFRATLR